ncbi:RAS-LIKE GTP-BINDING PROTEIN (RHO subfamily) [Encephalitozoon cuniculi GB-M1]|uniref:RAS-LIKE GTP-BINDING PROTEIN (RHO subfamily) n=2 Tax=Encephalitozoon cuniculi TaxID=6035 RepID=Q8SSH9_ENCCU|nr:Ras-like GTP binding protein [Encephalitozoon cuniculi GB-M1]AGE95593.1 ras-like GTP-binding protein [Encephalitozoon cuniculi]KMV66561.1 Ras-like GTP binding protein [Encephalitozoon cuniculi EcunIII-L]UYI28230.1 Rho GTPase [Encephalitozoon cuniculi]CAD25072.1 RAS-LIKE GTP-BINDING PROTEIN (RHO subfamily) [Encephalitozoon cuniculi GB-M1]
MAETATADVSKQLTIIGSATCGKTSILTRHVKRTFGTEISPTVFNSVSNTYKHKDHVIELRLWDTAGQDEYARFRHLALPSADYIMIVYAVDDRSSYAEVKNSLVGQVREKAPQAKYFLVGAKTDLREDSARLEELARNGDSPITTSEGLELSQSIGAMGYFECSAKNNVGIDEIFEKISEYALRAQQKESMSFIGAMCASLWNCLSCRQIN